MDPHTVSYDQQAQGFDARVGLSDPVAQRVAQAVLDHSGVGAQGRVLEIGAGTGELSRWLCDRDTSYIGIDSSAAMLEQFRRRLPNASRVRLICTDANTGWPAEPATRSVASARGRAQRCVRSGDLERQTSPYRFARRFAQKGIHRGGGTPTGAVKDRILSDLSDCATETFGDLRALLSGPESYILEGARLRATAGSD